MKQVEQAARPDSIGCKAEIVVSIVLVAVLLRTVQMKRAFAVVDRSPVPISLCFSRVFLLAKRMPHRAADALADSSDGGLSVEKNVLKPDNEAGKGDIQISGIPFSPKVR